MTAILKLKQLTLFSSVILVCQLYDVVHADLAEEQRNHTAEKTDSSSVSNPQKSDERKSPTKQHPQGLVSSSSIFSEIRHSPAFVDKTFFLHEWLMHRPKYWYVTAPPGFGKSTLATMAVQFLNASYEIVNGTTRYNDKHKTPAYELFRDTNIFEMREFCDEHFQNHAVIFLDLAPLSTTTQATFKKAENFNSQDFHKNFKIVIKKMMNYYPSLLHHKEMTDSERKSFERYLEEGIDAPVGPGKFWQSAFFLMQLLRKCVKKNVVVIVDSYDALCIPSMFGETSLVHRPYLASYIINFSRFLLKDEISTVLYLGSFNTVELMLRKPSELLRLTPTSHTIVHTKFFSTERVAKYFGLSAQEVMQVLENFSMQDHFTSVDNLLNGHAVLESPLTLFNTRSVLLYVANRNTTPSAVTLPLTSEIIHKYRKVFALQFVGNVVNEIIFKGSSEVTLKPPKQLSFTSFTRLKILAIDSTTTDNKQIITLENSLSFIKILQFLGVLSVIHESRVSDRHAINLRASSYIDTELMNEHFYHGGYTQKFFNISAENDLAMMSSIEKLAPTNESIQFLAEAIRNIVREKVPETESQLKALIYVFSRKTATQHGVNFTLESRVAIPTAENPKSNESGKLRPKSRVDIILLMKNEGIGIIMTSKFNTNATSVLKEMSDKRYFDIFDTDGHFSNLTIKDKMLIGISVSRDKSVELAAEVWCQDEKTSLKHVLLNNASLL
nr:PREDICTED: uncharacterized protein LOC109040913 [Bemisia tabaci]XP_018912579.1 PREDICTED: uncharacterized protein LOC109040913 [Bemisia tabaci]